MTDDYSADDEAVEEKQPGFKLERIDIPPECREIKAWFRERPGIEIVDEIKEHIANTGKPYTWRGHTHTKPPQGSKPVYLEEFDLPAKLIKVKRFAPCPCCNPETPKYGHNGKIGWFPSEGVIRLLGPDCFKSLDAEGHEDAKRQLEIERRRKQDTDYLLSKLPLLPDVIAVGERALSVAKSLDDFRDDLLSKLELDRFPLWDYVRHGGELRITTRSQEFRRGAGAAMQVEDVDVERVYATLDSYEILDPDLTSCVATLQRALQKLREHNPGDTWRETLDGMEDREKTKTAQAIGSGVKSIETCVRRLQTLRRFAERVTINTLRGWGEHEGCPAPRFFEHHADRIAFGRSEYQNYVVQIPTELSADIGIIRF